MQKFLHKYPEIGWSQHSRNLFSKITRAWLKGSRQKKQKDVSEPDQNKSICNFFAKCAPL